MLDRVDHVFSDIGNVRAKVFDELFHIFALRVLIGGAGVKDDGKLVSFRDAADILFVGVKKGTNNGGLGAAEIGSRGEGRKPAFIGQREQEGFEDVVRVMPESDFVRAFALSDGAERAAAKLGAKGAGVRLLSDVENDFGDVGFFLEKRDVSLLEVRAKGGKLLLFGLFEAHVYVNGDQGKLFGGEFRIAIERFEKNETVFPARNSDGDLITVFDHLKIGYRAPKRSEDFFHSISLVYFLRKRK